MGILNSILRAVTWWDKETYGTQLFTWRHGEKVGEDADGNVYYHTGDDRKRWVVYSGEIEATKVPPGWHGWLHRLYDEPPSVSAPKRLPWEKPAQENLSGTDMAYHPAGTLYRLEPVKRSDYEAWTPE
ncbi:NADH:ubiquinone oxidoreductase subunit NDUFA12 [Tropicimonas sp.]|uniref:NADH:ubiquinone oxidoreductase subunit NDUFA12 n=1 Tax=Tropicimonas sp. TaxID=2067044 RepID=UPI003A8C1D15